MVLDPSELTPALLRSVGALVQRPKAELSLVDPVLST